MARILFVCSPIFDTNRAGARPPTINAILVEFHSTDVESSIVNSRRWEWRHTPAKRVVQLN